MSAQRASSHHGTTVHAEAVATREDHWENGVGVIGSPTDSASEDLHSITARYGGGTVACNADAGSFEPVQHGH